MEKSGREILKRHSAIVRGLEITIGILPSGLKRWLLSAIVYRRGRGWMLLRYCLVRHLAAGCGENVGIKDGVHLFNLHNITFGNNVSIHSMCYLDGRGGIAIGDNVSIAHDSSIVSFDHSYGDADLPIKYNPIVGDRIVIGDDVWIGCGVRILAGARIDSRVIVGAGAVVKGELERDCLYAGVPVKRIKRIAPPECNILKISAMRAPFAMGAHCA